MTTDMSLWRLADALGIDLNVTKGSIRGDVRRSVMFGTLKVGIPLRIISSLKTKDNAIVIMKSLGNLGLVADSDIKGGIGSVTVKVLDLSALTVKPAEYLEQQKFKTPKEVHEALGPAVVKTFRRVGSASWQEATEHAGTSIGHLDNG